MCRHPLHREMTPEGRGRWVATIPTEAPGAVKRRAPAAGARKARVDGSVWGGDAARGGGGPAPGRHGHEDGARTHDGDFHGRLQEPLGRLAITLRLGRRRLGQPLVLRLLAKPSLLRGDPGALLAPSRTPPPPRGPPGALPPPEPLALAAGPLFGESSLSLLLLLPGSHGPRVGFVRLQVGRPERVSLADGRLPRRVGCGAARLPDLGDPAEPALDLAPILDGQGEGLRVSNRDQP